MTYKAILVIFSVGLSTFLANYMAASVNLALKTIALEFVVNPSELSLVLSVYLLGTSLCIIPLGRITDIYGAKRILLLGCSFFALTNIMIYFWAQDFASLLILRCLQGMAAAFVHVSHIPVIVSNIPKTYRATALGILAAITYLGFTIGSFAGGVITELWGWRVIFMSTAIGALAALAIILGVVSSDDGDSVPKSPKNMSGFDFKGTVIYAVALILLQLGAQHLDNNFSFLILLTAGLAFAAFVRRQYTVNNPIYDVKLFQINKIFAVSNIGVFFNFFGTYGAIYLVALYLQCNLGLSPFEAGAVIFVQSAVQIIFAPLGGMLADRMTPLFVANTGMTLLSIAYLGLAAFDENTSLFLIYITLALMGIGVSLFASPNTTMLMNSVVENKKGMASASLSIMRNLGMQLSMIFCGAMFLITLGDIEGIPPEKYGQMLTVLRSCYIVFALGSIITVFLGFWPKIKS